jgi:hypothetical protein
MGILDFFKKKAPKNKYQIYHESISEVLELLKRKKQIVESLKDGDSELDFSFDQNMFEKLMLFEIIKSGSISFLGNDFKNHILEIFDNSELKKDEIMNIWNYLLNEQDKLSKLF